MDVLTDVLRVVRLQNLVFGRLELTAPWGGRRDASRDHAGFYVVSRGACWLELDGGPKVQLTAGDFVFLTGGQKHVLRDHPRSHADSMDRLWRRARSPDGVLRAGGGGALTSIVAGCFLFEDGGKNPLVAALPPLLHVRGDSPAAVEWLESTLKLVAAESGSSEPGAQMLVSRLADVLFVQAIRSHLKNDGARGWLGALADAQVGGALGLVHERPEAAWTVEELAARVAMSRSAFAARFSALVGEPPLAYLTRWRMHKAARLLRDGQAGVAEIAGRVGYQAEASFSKAFKRWSGDAPGQYRRAARAHSPL